MKAFDITCILGAAILLCVAVNAKEFQNLEFEDGIPSGLHDVVVEGVHVQAGDSGKMLPGWQVKYDGVVSTSIYYDNGPVSAGMTLIDNTPRIQTFYGQYSLGVWATLNFPNQDPGGRPMSISQTGTVPADAVGLTYNSTDLRISVLVNGELVPAREGFADIRKYAGSEVKLEFDFQPSYIGRFDLVKFTSVPEPSTIALFIGGVSAALLEVRRRRQ